MTEKLLLVCVTKGAHRQEMHEHLRGLCFSLFESQLSGVRRDIKTLVLEDELVSSYLSASDVHEIFEGDGYIGNCEERCSALVQMVRQSLN